jgi:glycine oxidase
MEHADVVVVGAGLIGSSIAWRLAQRGKRVVLLDKGEPGTEASWAAAGVLIPTAGETVTQLYQLYRASHAAYPAFVDEVRDATGSQVEFRQCGQLVLAFDEREEGLLRQRLEHQRRADFPAELLSPEEARRLEPAINPELRLALRFPTHGLVDNRTFARSMVAAALRTGVTVRANEAVLSLSLAGDRVTGVETSRSSISADVVVNAAGAWSSQLTPWLKGAMTAAKGEIIALRTERRPVDHIVSVNAGTASVSTRSDGRSLAHATHFDGIFDKDVRGSSVRYLLGVAERAVPGLSDAPFYEAWAGLRPLSADGLPIIGPDQRTGLLWATGHHGNGILSAPITAEIIARLVHGEPSPVAIDDFSPRRFERATVST